MTDSLTPFAYNVQSLFRNTDVCKLYIAMFNFIDDYTMPNNFTIETEELARRVYSFRESSTLIDMLTQLYDFDLWENDLTILQNVLEDGQELLWQRIVDFSESQGWLLCTSNHY